jgi:DNA-binding NtrC family response regulator
MPVPKSFEETTRIFGTETVLTVEDEADVRAYTVAALKAYGYRAIKAENPQDALLIFERESAGIDLVLTDVVMPKMSGRELAARLAELRPSVKILYTSGYTSDTMARHGILEEGLVLLEKPFSPEQLAQKVRQVLGPPKPLSRVLVLGNDELRGLLYPLLTRCGHEVVEAAAGSQFQWAGQADPVDLIITELAAQEQQAIETMRALRRQMPLAAVIAILEVSGGQFLEMERLVQADAVMAKPISTEFLLRTVKEVLAAVGKRP